MGEAVHSPSSEPLRSASSPGQQTVRSLAPREHGAWGQLGLPLLVAHLTGPATAAGWLFTAGAIAAFLAHEPFLVTIGRRGPRARQADGARAHRILLIAAGIGAVAMTAGLVLAPVAARVALIGCGLLGLLVRGKIVRGRERSLLGELLVATTLPALAVPVAMAAGQSASGAVGTWLVWMLGATAATCAVRDGIAHFKQGRPLARRLLPIGLVAIAGGAAVAGPLWGWEQLAASSPMVVASLTLALRPPHPRHLRRVGWTLVAASVATTVALVVFAG